MKTIKNLALILILFLMSFNLYAQKKNLRTVKVQSKEYNFNPDYPDFYYGEHKIFLEAIWYHRKADLKIFKNRYLIVFSGMSSKGYISTTWGFNKLEDFLHYQNLIENKKYYRILLKKPKESLIGDIIVLMHPKRKIPKL